MTKNSTAKAGTVAGYKAGKGGQKVRSGGAGQGLQRGQGKGPVGRPVKRK